MTTQQFIEKAIEGGWTMEMVDKKHVMNLLPSIVLDPLAWQAVGKVEGWSEAVCVGCGASNIKDCDCHISHVPLPVTMELWLYNMHCMIDALADGKTIEQYLETL